MNSFLSILIPILLHLTEAQRFPNWPEDFYWTHDGALNPHNYTCLHFEAPQEPFLNYWDKNFLCVKKGADLLDPQMEWSYSGPMGGNKSCLNIKEPEDPHGWESNYLCLPNDTVYNFTWSHGGCDKTKFCLRINAPMDQHTWYDNYLCHNQTGPGNFSQTGINFCLYYFNGAGVFGADWTILVLLVLFALINVL